jgi:Vitamin K-dependent gamma-carboxylase
MGNWQGMAHAGRSVRAGRWLDRIEYSPNLQALAAFRVLFAGYLLVQFAYLLPYYDAFYGADGILPLSAFVDYRMFGVARLLPLMRLLDAAHIGAIIPIILPLSLVALAAGYRTRWACGIALALEGYLFWRNPVVGTGAEVLAWLLLLWCMFLPINRYWSVDAALDRLPRRRAWPALPFFAIRLQIASLYFFSALFKLEGEPWQKGYALLWTLQDTAFAATPAASFFVEHLPGVVVLVNYLVIAFQLAFAYLIYSPWRNELTRAIAITGSALMHLSFIAFMRIGGFPYICLIMLVLLVPDAWIDRLLRRRRERLRDVAIYYEPSCGFCEKVARLLREFLLVPEVKVRPASADRAALRLLTRHGSWVVVEPSGKAHLKWRAMAYVLAQCALTRPLGWLTDLPVLRPAMARLYDCIGAHRRAFSAVTRVVLPFRSDRPPGRFALALNGTLAVLALLCNLVNLDQWTLDRPQAGIHFTSYEGIRNGLQELFALTQVHQDWALFSPSPTHFRWSFEFSAFDRAGHRTDVTAAMPFVTVSDGGRVRLSRVYWALYFSHVQDFTESEWAGLGAYICRVVARLDKPAAAVEVTVERAPVPPVLQEPGNEVRRRLPCPPAAASAAAPQRQAASMP